MRNCNLNKYKSCLHIFLISNQMSAIVAYEYIHEAKLKKNQVRIIFLRGLNLNLFSSMTVYENKRGIFQKIADRFLIKYFSYASRTKRIIESYKKNFILYTAWFDDLASAVVKSKKCKGHIYLEEGELSYKDLPIFSSSKSYYRAPKSQVGEYSFTDYYREDALLWIGVSKNSFPYAPKNKKYILKSFAHTKKKYVPFLEKYKNILLLPTPARLPKYYWKTAIKKLTTSVSEPFALKLHPGYGSHPSVFAYFNSILKDLGFSNFVVCNKDVIIEAEMLFSKKVLIGDRCSLFRYASLLGSSIAPINFLWATPNTVYILRKKY
jgi:hypothetical protein